MKYLCTLFIVAVLAGSCKKDKEQTHVTPDPVPLKDFLYLPVSDATWKVHVQGILADPNDDIPDPSWITPGKYDTAEHTYFTITSTGNYVDLDGLRYYVYDMDTRIVYSGNASYNKTVSDKLYLREDTLYQKIYSWRAPGVEDLVVDYSREEVGDEADVPQKWPASYICDTNAVIIKGQAAKMWEVAYHYDKFRKYFYKAYGLGRQTGMVPRTANIKGSEPVSLEFIYKGESNKFEFDIHQ